MGNTIRTFIIDDNDTTRTVLRLTINGQPGFEVCGEAGDGDVGLNKALALRPDLVCLDISLPGSGGLDVLTLLRQFLPGTAVVMVTASNDMATVQTALARGAAGFIVKPFRVATVQQALQRAVQTLGAKTSLY